MAEETTTDVLRTHIAGVVEVAGARQVTPLMRRVTLTGEALAGLDAHWRPEMLVRLYFPPAGSAEPPQPFLDDNGELDFRSTDERNRVSPFSAFAEDPLVRAFTGRRFDAASRALDVDFVLHPAPGLASDWARAAEPGDRIGIVEFGLPPGHDPATRRGAGSDVFVMFADEAALPALQTNLEVLDPGTRVLAFVEVADEHEEQEIATAGDVTITWLHRDGAEPGTSGLLQKAARELELPDGKVFAWVCGEIKMVTELRRIFKQDWGLERGSYKTQAYWRRGRTEVERMARMTEVTMEAAASGVADFMESFEEIGMNVEDPTLFEG
jgi:NADPH-dependent ferric siderophore reductase